MLDDRPGTGIDRRTGKVISGWLHVAQSLEVIFTTRFGERVMNEWFGSFIPALLGENLTVETVLRVKMAIWVAIAAWEPRFRVTQIKSISVARTGRYVVQIEGEYLPRGHLGDFTVEGARRVVNIPLSAARIEAQTP
jgi:phage baseplate assembly protein W